MQQFKKQHQQSVSGDIPQEWKITNLEDLSTRIMKGIFDLNPVNYVKKGIPFLRISDIKNNIIEINTTKFISEELNRKFPSSELHPGDLVISKVGSVGLSDKIAKIPISILNCNISQNIIGIKLDSQKLHSDYLLSLLQLPSYMARISSGSNTTTLKSIQLEVLRKLPIVLPSLKEQQKIIFILSNVDELIQKIDQIIEQTQRLKKGLMQRLLTKGIAQTKFKQTKLGEIPDKWQVRTLEHCVRSDVPITYGIVQAGPNVPGGIPYVRTGDMSAGRLSKEGLLHTSVEIDSSYPRSRVKAGEIVCALRGIVGSVLEVPEQLEGANLSRGVARISPGQDIYRRYLLWALRSEYARREFDIFSNGTTFKEIPLAQLRTIKVAVPVDIKEQVDLATIFDKLELVIDLRQRFKEKLVILKAGLMQQLLTGKIRVKV